MWSLLFIVYVSTTVAQNIYDPLVFNPFDGVAEPFESMWPTSRSNLPINVAPVADVVKPQPKPEIQEIKIVHQHKVEFVHPERIFQGTSRSRVPKFTKKPFVDTPKEMEGKPETSTTEEFSMKNRRKLEPTKEIALDLPENGEKITERLSETPPMWATSRKLIKKPRSEFGQFKL